MSAPRIAPGDRSAIGLPAWLFGQVAGRAMKTQPPNLFTTLARHRGLFRGWLIFAGRLMPRGRLPRRDTELVILRVAHLRACTYEHEHHVRLGRRAGLTDTEIARVALGPDEAGWNEGEQLLLRAVDELHATGDLADDTWLALTRRYDDRCLIELVMLVGHYEMLATTITALRIQPDTRR